MYLYIKIVSSILMIREHVLNSPSLKQLPYLPNLEGESGGGGGGGGLDHTTWQNHQSFFLLFTSHMQCTIQYA